MAFGSQFAVISKPQFGSDYELDFILVERITVDLTWTIVELKKPHVRLFRVDGHFSSELNIAVSQTRDYQDWFPKNAAYATKRFPGVFKPRALLHIGRRSSDRNARNNAGATALR